MFGFIKAIYLIISVRIISKIADHFQRKADVINDLNQKTFSLVNEQKNLIKESADAAVAYLSASENTLEYKVAKKVFDQKREELIELERESVEFEKAKENVYRKNWNLFDKILWKIMDRPRFRGHSE